MKNKTSSAILMVIALLAVMAFSTATSFAYSEQLQNAPEIQPKSLS